MILMMLWWANWSMLLRTSQSDAVFVTSSGFHPEPAPLSLLPPAFPQQILYVSHTELQKSGAVHVVAVALFKQLHKII
jgi:hypothetical protein